MFIDFWLCQAPLRLTSALKNSIKNSFMFSVSPFFNLFLPLFFSKNKSQSFELLIRYIHTLCMHINICQEGGDITHSKKVKLRESFERSHHFKANQAYRRVKGNQKKITTKHTTDKWEASSNQVNEEDENVHAYDFVCTLLIYIMYYAVGWGRKSFFFVNKNRAAMIEYWE